MAKLAQTLAMGVWREVSDESADEQDGLHYTDDVGVQKLGRRFWGQRYQWTSATLSTVERASSQTQARGNLLSLHVVRGLESFTQHWGKQIGFISD